MIQINLLIKPKPTDWRRVGMLLLAVLTLVAFALYGITWWLGYRRLGTELKALQDLVGDYQAKLALDAEITAQESAVGKELTTLDGLGRRQVESRQSIPLSAIFASVPPSVTVTGVAVKADGTVDIAGKASSFSEAIRFRDELKKQSTFSALKENNYTGNSGETSFSFTVNVKQGGDK